MYLGTAGLLLIMFRRGRLLPLRLAFSFWVLGGRNHDENVKIVVGMCKQANRSWL